MWIPHREHVLVPGNLVESTWVGRLGGSAAMPHPRPPEFRVKLRRQGQLMTSMSVFCLSNISCAAHLPPCCLGAVCSLRSALCTLRLGSVGPELEGHGGLGRAKTLPSL